MGVRGRKTVPIVLQDSDREVLVRWSKRPRSPHSIAQRARIILLAAEGRLNQEICTLVDVNHATVTKWRKRFVEGGVDALLDEPRVGAPRKFGDDEIEKIVVKTLESKPENSTHWSTREMAAATGMSQPTVARIWKAFGLKPWLTETFKLSEDPQFIEKVRDIVGLYLDPPLNAVVLCVDEKPGIQALDRTQPVLPMRPGVPERQTHDYKRNGLTDLFAALNVATGEVISMTRRRHRAEEFKAFLNMIDKAVPADLDVHCVIDNASTHKTPDIKAWQIRHPRFHFHFTPTSSSWLNLVERFFAEITRRLLRRSVHINTLALEADITKWIAGWNENPRPFVWHKTADEILESLARYLARTSESGH
jgi:transposase